MGRDRIIETYVQRLLAWKKPLTADSLNVIAQEAGLNLDEMAAVQQKVQEKARDHFKRGSAYLESDCLDEAIDELTQATTLDPSYLEAIQTLAYAYDQRYGKRKNASDQKQAIALVKRCVEINPNSEAAFMLISTQEYRFNQRQRPIWLGLAILLAIAGGKPVMDILSQRSEVQQLTQAALQEFAENQNTAAQNPDSSTDGAIPAAIDIPITFEQPDLSLEARLSRLDNYEDSSYYTLQAVLLNNSNQEIKALQLDIECLDSDGIAIATDSKVIITPNDATLRPGDYHSIDLLQKVTPALSDVRLRVAILDQLPAPPNYDPAVLIPYTWSSQQPSALNFELAARRENINSYDLTDSTYFDTEWAITNTGGTDIHKLKLQVSFYNQSGKVILREDILPVYGGNTPMLPNEIRPIRINKSIDKDYTRYKVTVLEAE